MHHKWLSFILLLITLTHYSWGKELRDTWTLSNEEATEAYEDKGEKVWSRQLNIYGETRRESGEKNFIPFRYQGQYEDVETSLFYNRFRYYSPSMGSYISQDPIGLEGKSLNLYSYVSDVNSEIDPFGLACQGVRSVDDICKKYGGKKTGNNRYKFEGPGAKKRAKQAASEISGDLGSDPKAIRRKEYIDPNNTLKDNNSNRVIGKHSSNVDSNGKPISGYHDHEIGHSRFDAPRHFNAWSESTGTHYTDNVHLYY